MPGYLNSTSLLYEGDIKKGPCSKHLVFKAVCSQSSNSEILFGTVEWCEFSLGFPGGSDSKESACNAGDWGSVPGLEEYSGEGNGGLI